MSRDPETAWPLALVMLVLLGLAWLVMAPFRVLLRDGPEEDTE